MTRYINPWHSRRRRDQLYVETDTKPLEHAGCLIYRRGKNWDVVVNGVCVAQRGGLNGAKRVAEAAAREIAAARAGFAAQEANVVDVVEEIQE